MTTLFKYTASTGEDHMERGTVIAQTEDEAKKKLRAMQFQTIYVKSVNGFMGWLGRWTADIK